MSEFDNALSTLETARQSLAEISAIASTLRDCANGLDARVRTATDRVRNLETVIRAAVPPEKAALTAEEKAALTKE
jgi:hypothetical protein